MNTRNPNFHLGLSIALIVCGCALLLLTALNRDAGGPADYAIGAGLLAAGSWNLWTCLRNRGNPGEETGGDAGGTR